jgi:glycolate oxidase FAD binding subunit
MVASGLSGPARVSVGSVRDYVLGVSMLNGRAEELRFGGQVMKNVAGYDVSRVMAGAMGTLGMITEVSLKVLPKAPAEATLMMAMPQAQALQQLHRWMAQPLPLNASCWVHDDSAQPAQDFLFVRLRGAQAAVEAACLRMASDVQQQGFAVSRMDNAGAAGDWQACADQQLPFFQPEPAPQACLWRLSLPPTAPVLDLPSSPLIEWHGGLRWLWAPASEAAQLRELAQRHGGHATLWRTRSGHGAEDRRVGVFTPLPPVQQKLQQALQAEFDPHAVFKTGRLGL